MSTDLSSLAAFVRFMRKHGEETMTYHPETGCLVSSGCNGQGCCSGVVDMVALVDDLRALTGVPSKEEVAAEEKADRRAELQAKLDRVPQAWPKERAMVEAEIATFEKENGSQ
jgi:hypothetical protein